MCRERQSVKGMEQIPQVCRFLRLSAHPSGPRHGRIVDIQHDVGLDVGDLRRVLLCPGWHTRRGRYRHRRVLRTLPRVGVGSPRRAGPGSPRPTGCRCRGGGAPAGHVERTGRQTGPDGRFILPSLGLLFGLLGAGVPGRSDRVVAWFGRLLASEVHLGRDDRVLVCVLAGTRRLLGQYVCGADRRDRGVGRIP